MDEAQPIQFIGQRQIADLARHAETGSRKRAHLLLHDGPDDQVQRMLIMLQPETYIRPHHHSRQWELLILQRGRANLLRFSDVGYLLDRLEMAANSPIAQIPIGTWHSFLVLEPNTAVVEIKPGPCQPNEFAEWAPPEGDADSARFVEWVASAQLGSAWRSATP